MSEKYNIEELLIKKLEGLEIEPSGNVWLKTQRMLRRKQFLRFQVRRFNIFYASAIVLLVGVGSVMLISGPENKEKGERRKEEVVQEQSQTNNLSAQEAIGQDVEGDIKRPSSKKQDYSEDKVKASQKSEVRSQKSEVREDQIDNDERLRANEEKKEVEIVEVKTMITYFTPSVREGCVPLKVEFIDLSENAFSREWLVDNVEVISGQSFTFKEAGEYKVSLKTISEDGSIGYYSEVITVHPKPIADFEIVDGRVFNYSLDATDYAWTVSEADEIMKDFQPDLKNASLNLNEGTRLFLTAKNSYGCTDTISSLLPLPPSPALNFPTAFSPNPSGPSSGYYNPNEYGNDIFHPRFTEEPIEYNLTIYNRAGELIFQSNDIQIGWDGYYREAPVIRGVYVWKCTGKWKNGKIINQQGDITALWTN